MSSKIEPCGLNIPRHEGSDVLHWACKNTDMIDALRAENQRLKNRQCLLATTRNEPLCDEWSRLQAENERLRQHLEQVEGIARQLSGAHDEVQRVLAENEQLRLACSQWTERDIVQSAEIRQLRAVIDAARAIALRNSPTHQRLREALEALSGPQAASE